jgi:hypothetical protein
MRFFNALYQMRRRSWLCQPRPGWTQRPCRQWEQHFVPRLHLLEDRCVPSTITPRTFADGGLGSGSLRDAVLQFNADTGTEDDIIQLEAGTYSLTIRNTHGHENAGLEGDLNLNQTSHRWIIHGAGTRTIIDAGELQDRAFQIVNARMQVVFQDLVIQGGVAQDNGTQGAQPGTTDALGGGILNNGGNVRLNNVLLQYNVVRGGDAAVKKAPGYSASGAAIYSTGGALTIAGARIVNNQAIGGRGGDSSQHAPAGNGGSAGGGGLYAGAGSLDISDSRIANNRATGGPGGNGGFVQTTTYGGGFGLGGAGGMAQGAGLYVNGSSLTVASSAIASNQGTGGYAGFNGWGGLTYGGGLYILVNADRLTVSNCTLSDNSVNGLSGYVGYGGGIYNAWGSLTLSASTLSGNSTNGNGGGIYNYFGTLTVSNCTLSNNTGGYGAGGIFNYSGTVTVTGSTLSGNSAQAAGGISNYGTLTISNSTLSGNTATYSGGGIYNYGGGIYNYGEGPVTLTNVTLTANRADTAGGGLFVQFGAPGPVLHNTLIADNFSGASGTTRDDVSGALNASGDYNLIGDGTGMTGLTNDVNGNLVGTASAPIDPLLGPLQDNGGRTQTHALLPGSPAIDAGNNAYATEWDQRGEGFPRIVNGIIDIGAFEVQEGAGAAPRGRSLVNRLIPAGIALGPEVWAPIKTVFASDEQQLGPLPVQALVEAPTRWHDHADASSIPRIVQRSTDAVFAAGILEAQSSELMLWFS